MKIGISTFVWCSPFSTNSFDIIPKIKQMGYDNLDVAVEEPSIIDWEKLNVLTEDLGLEVTLSGAFGLNRDISNEDEAIRKNGMNYINECLKICEKLNCNRFGGPFYSAVGKTRPLPDDEKKKERERCMANLKIVGRLAGEKGVIIGIEPLNRFENDMINTVDQALLMIKEIDSPNIKLLIDTFHANIEEKSIPMAIKKAGHYLCHIHGNENDRGIPGTGHIDWKGIRNALREIGYDETIVIETFGTISVELARAASIWRPLAESSDILAIEGLHFFANLFKKK
jgi:D-psicose/D-tagatose/L-ribulose 3-epimerase